MGHLYLLAQIFTKVTFLSTVTGTSNILLILSGHAHGGMIHPPYWLTSRGVDQLTKGEHLDNFSKIHSKFMDAFEEEEKLLLQTEDDALQYTQIMRQAGRLRTSGTFMRWTVPRFI